VLTILRQLIRRAFGKKRVHGEAPMDDLPCDWCHEVKHTTVNEIWCEADPSGYLRRLCDDCCSHCVG
jgi:hypothetical protein